MRISRWLPFALLVILPLAAFAQTFTFDFVAMDDELLILDNTKVHGLSFENIKDAFTTYDPELYVPLTLLTYQIEWSLFGPNPAVFHATNLLLHIMSGILVFLILRRFMDGRVALLCALLWSIHPLQAEAVAWASARKDLLSGLFFFLSIHLYLRSKDEGVPRHRSILAFLAGLLSKVSIFPLPFVLLLLDWLRGERLDRERIREKIPYFLLSAIFLAIALFGKQTQALSPLIPILLSPTAIFLALKHFFVPVDLSIFYPFTDAVSLMHPAILLGIAGLIAVLAIAAWSARHTRSIAAGLGIFLLLLGPSLLNMQKGGLDGAFDIYLSSDRYVYAAMLGLLIILGRMLAGRIKIILVPVIAGFAALAFLQAGTWKNSEALFAQAVAAEQESHVAYNNLAGIRAMNGDYDEAVVLYKQSIAIKKNERALFNLGQIQAHQKDYVGAIATLEELVTWKPRYAQAHAVLGHIYFERGNGQSAYIHLIEANKLDPNLFQARKDLGLLYAALGKNDLARQEFEEAYRLNPKDPEVAKRLGR